MSQQPAQSEHLHPAELVPNVRTLRKATLFAKGNNNNKRGIEISVFFRFSTTSSSVIADPHRVPGWPKYIKAALNESRMLKIHIHTGVEEKHGHPLTFLNSNLLKMADILNVCTGGGGGGGEGRKPLSLSINTSIVT